MGLAKLCCSCCTFLAVLVAVVAALLGHIQQDLEPIVGEKALPYNDEHCELIGAHILRGSEDMAIWRDGLVLVSGGELDVCFRQGAQNTTSTGMFVVSLPALEAATTGPAREAAVRRLALEAFPAEEPELVAHGIYLSNSTGRLYVINHGDYMRNVSRVEVFSVEGRGFDDLRLRHVDRIESEKFPLHCINDVAEGASGDHVFVSVWREAAGVEEYNTKQEQWDVLKVLKYRYLGDPSDLGVLSCTKSAGGWRCERSGAWSIPMANGLTVSPDRRTLLVSCPLCFEVWVYALDADGTVSGLRNKIALPYSADNLEWDVATGQVFMGMIPIPARKPWEPHPAELAALATDQLHAPQAAMRSILVHNASKMNQSASGLQYGEAVLIGTPYHPGVLYCRRPGLRAV